MYWKGAFYTKLNYTIDSPQLGQNFQLFFFILVPHFVQYDLISETSIGLADFGRILYSDEYAQIVEYVPWSLPKDCSDFSPFSILPVSIKSGLTKLLVVEYVEYVKSDKFELIEFGDE